MFEYSCGIIRDGLEVSALFRSSDREGTWVEEELPEHQMCFTLVQNLLIISISNPENLATFSLFTIHFYLLYLISFLCVLFHVYSDHKDLKFTCVFTFITTIFPFPLLINILSLCAWVRICRQIRLWYHIHYRYWGKKKKPVNIYGLKFILSPTQL